MERACQEASRELDAGKETLCAVQAAITILENEPTTNAGYGSNLSMTGHVEGDASVMVSDGTFGAVGAIPWVPNPIMVATCLALESRKRLPCGLIPPIMIAGDGARMWAKEKGLRTFINQEEADKQMISSPARQRHKRYLEILRNSCSESSESRLNRENKYNIRDCMGDDVRNDTVGCIVVESNGDMAAGVSSGGIALKAPGRVGEAAIFGAGCWVESQEKNKQKICTATSVTGVGEKIVKYSLAQRTGSAALNIDAAVDFTCSKVIADTIGTTKSPKDCGILCVRTYSRKRKIQIEMGAVCHAAPSMAIGWLEKNEFGKFSYGNEIIRQHEKTEGNVEMSVGKYWKFA